MNGPLRLRVVKAIHLLGFVALAVLASPLPLAGWLLVRRGWTQRGLAVLLSGAVSTALGVVAAWWAPLSVGATAVVIAGLWAAGGLVVGLLASDAGTAERAGPWRPDWIDVAWLAAGAVAFGPLAVVMAMLQSYWGFGLAAKPSFAAEGLAALVALALSFAVLVGLMRRAGIGLGGRAALVFPACWWFVATAGLLAVALHELTVTGVFEVPVQDPSDLALGWVLGVPIDGAAALLLATIAALWCSRPRSIRHLLVRVAASAALALIQQMAVDQWTSRIPYEHTLQRAERLAASEDLEAALERWVWLARRDPVRAYRDDVEQRMLRDALRTRDPAWVRAALDLPEPLQHPPVSVQSDLRAGLPRLGEGALERVEVALRPVRKESYLDPTWAALTTAVATVRPELEELEIKRRVRTVETAIAEDELGLVPDPLTAARLVAGLFDLEVIAAPPGLWQPLLAAGYPPLVRQPDAGYGVVWWLAPQLGAMLELDYRLWDEEEIARREAGALFGAGQAHHEAILTMASRARSFARSRHDVGPLAIALVPRGDAFATRDRAAEALVELENLTEAWQAMAWGDSPRAGARAARILDDRVRDEVDSLVWMHAAAGDRTASGAAAMARCLERGETVSRYWVEHATRHIEKLDCVTGDRLAEVLATRQTAPWVRVERLAAQGDPAAIELGLAYARQQGWQPQTVERVLDSLAELIGRVDPNLYRGAMVTLLAKLPPSAAAGDFEESGSPVTSEAAKLARAAIADPSRSVRSWRGIVLEQPSAIAWRGLAASLEAIGDREGAQVARAEATLWAVGTRCAADAQPTPAASVGEGAP